jgi:hypothetical protein
MACKQTDQSNIQQRAGELVSKQTEHDQWYKEFNTEYTRLTGKKYHGSVGDDLNLLCASMLKKDPKKEAFTMYKCHDIEIGCNLALMAFLIGFVLFMTTIYPLFNP